MKNWVFYESMSTRLKPQRAIYFYCKLFTNEFTASEFTWFASEVMTHGDIEMRILLLLLLL